MAANDSGFSAPDLHGQPPSLPPVIIAMANGMMAQNAQAFREPAPPLLASDEAGVNSAPSLAAGGGGVGNASAEAPGVVWNKVQENAGPWCARNAVRKVTWRRRAVGLARALPVALNLP